ncbi:conoCAP-like [Babylonia areolata]|uniref:conoCAP-like n=1 Tax=Babylonia areolata TaxID=304850 RepID=UPI003FD19B61
MVSRGHVLYFMLLPVLAQVAADDAEEQLMSEVMSGDQDSAAPGRPGTLVRSRPHSPLPDPRLPPPFLLQLLQASEEDTQRPAPAPLLPSHPDPSSQTGEQLDDNGDISKRVFCNGFTGCGGRHRDRSRRQGRAGKRLIPVLVKRPFCNSFGCYNGKRSSSLSSLVEPVDRYTARALARMLAAAYAAREQRQREGVQRLGPLSKRLFCNGYGGCRGGKRSLFSPWMSKLNGVVGDRR